LNLPGAARSSGFILSSAESSHAAAPEAESTHWDDVRRIYRRICLLREKGRAAEAASLESAEFSRALTAARSASKTGGEEARVLAEEAERVSAACLLAEVVAPLLAECLREDPDAAIALKPTAAPDLSSSRRTIAAAPRPAAAPSRATPTITDLIDGMLSLDAGPRPRAAR
jgi:hypothetical protein